MITIYIVLQAALFLLSIAGFFQVRRFLKQNSSIASSHHLDNFKRLARANMYGALVYIVLGIPTVLLSVYLGFMYGLYGIGVVLAFSVPQMLFGTYLKSMEDKTRNMQCMSEYLDEHRRIGQTWMKKAVPDF